jgi:enoyl-CoA hydratase/carnithine racemase
MSADEQFHVSVVSPAYWRVTFDNGAVNLLDPDTVEQLGALIERIESDPQLTVIVFRSEKPGYFMAHWDFLADSARVARMQPGPTGLHPYLDNFVRLSKVAAATVAEIRGRTRGAGSEFVLATDIRFASDQAIFGQFEVGVGAVPGGGPMARLGRLVGRGRALEILLGGDDMPADLAAEYGYVNRLVPESENEGFVDAFAAGSPRSTRWRSPASRSSLTSQPSPTTKSSLRASRRTSRPPAARRLGRSYNGCSSTACNSPTASRQTLVQRSGGCDRSSDRALTLPSCEPNPRTAGGNNGTLAQPPAHGPEPDGVLASGPI